MLKVSGMVMKVRKAGKALHSSLQAISVIVESISPPTTTRAGAGGRGRNRAKQRRDEKGRDKHQASDDRGDACSASGRDARRALYVTHDGCRSRKRTSDRGRSIAKKNASDSRNTALIVQEAG